MLAALDAQRGLGLSLERERMKYSEKLKDPRWQRKRLEVLSRDDFTCLCCGDSSSTLNVHHKQYSGNPWDAPLDALETLCHACHESRGLLNKAFLNLPTASLGALNDLVRMTDGERSSLHDLACDHYTMVHATDPALREAARRCAYKTLEQDWNAP